MKTPYDDLLRHVAIPRFAKIGQRVETAHVEDPYRETVRALKESGGLSAIREGDSVCIACGSRDIANYQQIVRAAVDTVRALGGSPFLVPSMGSHGGATAQGQRKILLDYGLAADCVGAEIRSSMDTAAMGRTPGGLEVRIDRNAAAADHILLIARIKPHTDFHGPVESGMMKMIAIGLGKQHGASLCHSRGYPSMSRNIQEIAGVVIGQRPRITAVALLENARHETYQITAHTGEEIIRQEPGLLDQARSLLPRLPFKKCDTLFVSEMGKDISGPGMDPNVTGRSGAMGRSAPWFDSVAVFDLTDGSHHNGNGIGNADVTTQRLFGKLDLTDTYVNGITALEPNSVKLPPVMPNDRLAMQFALHLAYQADPVAGPKVVWLKNTLHMHCWWVSEGLLPLCRELEGLTVLAPPQEVLFDEEGNAVPLDW